MGIFICFTIRKKNMHNTAVDVWFLCPRKGGIVESSYPNEHLSFPKSLSSWAVSLLSMIRLRWHSYSSKQEVVLCAKIVTLGQGHSKGGQGHSKHFFLKYQVKIKRIFFFLRWGWGGEGLGSWEHKNVLQTSLVLFWAPGIATAASLMIQWVNATWMLTVSTWHINLLSPYLYLGLRQP